MLVRPQVFQHVRQKPEWNCRAARIAVYESWSVTSFVNLVQAGDGTRTRNHDGFSTDTGTDKQVFSGAFISGRSRKGIFILQSVCFIDMLRKRFDVFLSISSRRELSCRE